MGGDNRAVINFHTSRFRVAPTHDDQKCELSKRLTEVLWISNNFPVALQKAITNRTEADREK